MDFWEMSNRNACVELYIWEVLAVLCARHPLLLEPRDTGVNMR